MKKTLFFLTALVVGALGANASLIISQYVETEAGSLPKGIELWNSGAGAIDFSSTPLDVLKGTNGGALSTVFTLSAGSLSSNAVMVIASDNLAGEPLYDYMTINYPSVAFFSDGDFDHNGDDAFQVQLGSVVQDTFGVPGSDPGSAWEGGGVSTAGQSIQLKLGITAGDVDGWTDPSERFETVSITPSNGGSDLAGFGVAPVPEPSTIGVFGLGLFGLALRRRRS